MTGVCCKNYGCNISCRGWKDTTFLLRVPKKWTGPDNENMRVMSEHLSSVRSGKRKTQHDLHIASDTHINTWLNEFFTTTQHVMEIEWNPVDVSAQPSRNQRDASLELYYNVNFTRQHGDTFTYYSFNRTDRMKITRQCPIVVQKRRAKVTWAKL